MINPAVRNSDINGLVAPESICGFTLTNLSAVLCTIVPHLRDDGVSPALRGEGGNSRRLLWNVGCEKLKVTPLPMSHLLRRSRRSKADVSLRRAHVNILHFVMILDLCYSNYVFVNIVLG